MEGLNRVIPSQSFTFAFDSAMTRVFLSPDDDLGVRLASSGLPHASRTARSLAPASDKAALVGSLGSRRGRLDGQLVDESATEVSRRIPHARVASDEGDVLVLPEPIAEPIATQPPKQDELKSSSEAITLGGPVFQGCILWQHINTKTGKFCANWQPQGFRDLGASSTVVSEDFNGNGPAAYAQAVAKSDSTVLWQGRLDANGCTSTVEFCHLGEKLEVSSSSIMIPNQWVGTQFVYGTREFKIDPPATFVMSPSVRYSMAIPPYDYRVEFNVAQGSPVVRVASIVSRILTMGDNGVARNLSIASSFPRLLIQTDVGCDGYFWNPPYPPTFDYVDPVTGQTKLGEACAGAELASFGQSLALVESPPGTYTYVPTAWHTTQDAFTIGHELGHSAQYSMNGGPGVGPLGYNDKPAFGDCSCDWVADGNRTHCLQSRHLLQTAEVEGFAHLYATRVMNNYGPGLDARFTYYKTYRKKVGVFPPQLNLDLPPPYPVSAGSPYGGQGWVRSQCPGSGTSSEYDWLTFFWETNGKALASSRSSLNDIYAILGNASASFDWPNVRSKAEARFGVTDVRAAAFVAAGVASGLDQ